MWAWPDWTLNTAWNAWLWVALQHGISLKLCMDPVLRTAAACLIRVLFHSENTGQHGGWSGESCSFQERAKAVTQTPGCFEVRSQISRHVCGPDSVGFEALCDMEWLRPGREKSQLYFAKSVAQRSVERQKQQEERTWNKEVAVQWVVCP